MGKRDVDTVAITFLGIGIEWHLTRPLHLHTQGLSSKSCSDVSLGWMRLLFEESEGCYSESCPRKSQEKGSGCSFNYIEAKGTM